jgi:SAM-dependent methyltransferase
MNKIVQFNKKAWNKKVDEKNRWTQPVSSQEIQKARKGEWQVLLTPIKPVPADWFPEMKGADILCLASGGGQQAPIFAAAGANVTSFDNSPRQLDQDRFVADREGLAFKTIEGDMADLSPLPDESFDFIFNPASTCFIPSVIPVWKEAYRVLRKGGTLVTGFTDPVEYCFDIELYDKGIYTLKYSLPYSDLTSISEEERVRLFSPDEAVEFSHTLQDQIGGQLDAGFHLIGFYEDYRDDEKIKDYMPSFIATRALKPG